MGSFVWESFTVRVSGDQFDGFLGLGVGLTQLNTNSHIHPVGVVGSRFFVNPNQALRLDLQYSRPQAQYWDRTVTVDLWSLNAQWSYIFRSHLWF